jgi:hypothetical protein
MNSRPSFFGGQGANGILKKPVRVLVIGWIGVQHRDQAGSQVLGAETVHFIGHFRCLVTFPRELDADRLKLLRDPSTAKTPEDAHVTLARYGDAEFILLARQQCRFQNGSVPVGEPHISILEVRA